MKLHILIAPNDLWLQAIKITLVFSNLLNDNSQYH